MTLAEEAKKRGNEAWTSGDFAEAIKQFTEAIELDGKNAVYYSNRSAAYLSSGKIDEALSDAKKAVNLRPDWGKAYSRKGAALFWKKRYSEAIDTYRLGLEKEPTNAQLLEGLQSAEAKDRAMRGMDDGGGGRPAGANRRSYAPSSTPSSQRTNAGSGSVAVETRQGLVHFVMGSAANKFRSLQFVMRMYILMNVVMYVLPGGASSFRRAILGCMVLFGLSLINAHGTPQMNMQYAGRLVQDPYSQYMFLAFIFLAQRPYFFALIPLCLAELVHAAWYLTCVLSVAAPPVLAIFAGLLDRIMPAALGEAGWSTFSSDRRWGLINLRVPSWAAQVEVMLGVMLIVELVTPNRNLLLLVIFWQFLRLRYMASEHTKIAFRSLDMRLSYWFFHANAPPFLGNVYSKLRAWMGGMVQMPQQGQQPQGGGLLSRCSIM